MTMLIDDDLYDWIDNDVSLDSQELILKQGASDDIKKKFEAWKNVWDNERDKFNKSIKDAKEAIEKTNQKL